MNRVSTYLGFMGKTEEAFLFYGKVFGTEPTALMRMGEMGSAPGAPELSDEEKNYIAHVELPIYAGHVLMATDMLASMGHELRIGNNTTINIEGGEEDRAEIERLYAELSEGGSDSSGLNQMPWALWGSTLDKYGIRWMFNCYA